MCDYFVCVSMSAPGEGKEKKPIEDPPPVKST
jgi:hypothetical protein